MKYVLGENAARFLREQMAKDRNYKPAQPLPSREVRRDFAGGVSSKPKFHFAFKPGASSISIGEGAVQIGGYTYFVAEQALVEDISSGTWYVCVRVALAMGTATFTAFGSTSALQAAQADMAYYVFPLYRTVDGVVDLDYRPMPNAGSWEIAESQPNNGGGAS